MESVTLSPKQAKQIETVLIRLGKYMSTSTFQPINVPSWCETNEVKPVFLDALRSLEALECDLIRSTDERLFLRKLANFPKLKPEDVKRQMDLERSRPRKTKSATESTAIVAATQATSIVTAEEVASICTADSLIEQPIPEPGSVFSADQVANAQTGQTGQVWHTGPIGYPIVGTGLPAGVIHDNIVVTYGQPSDDDDEDNGGQLLHISSVFAPSGGHYTFIQTRRWALESPADLRVILADFESRTQNLINP